MLTVSYRVGPGEHISNPWPAPLSSSIYTIIISVDNASIPTFQTHATAQEDTPHWAHPAAPTLPAANTLSITAAITFAVPAAITAASGISVPGYTTASRQEYPAPPASFPGEPTSGATR
jgi:hypothetical protein